jgi:hypothetical protein
MRSRRLNHKKRKASAASSIPPTGLRSRENSIAEGEEGKEERKAPLELEILRKQASSPASLFSLSKTEDENDEKGYEPLEEDDDDDALDGDADPTVVVPGAQDPLADVFGTDEETWAQMHAEEDVEDGPDSRRTTIRRTVTQNPNVVQLAVNAGELGSLPEPGDEENVEEDGGEDDKDVEEVKELLERMSKPLEPEAEAEVEAETEAEVEVEAKVEVEAEAEAEAEVEEEQGSVEASPSRNRSSTGGTLKKHVPPPLKLEQPESSSTEQLSPAVPPSASTNLAYLSGESPEGPSPVGTEDVSPVRTENSEELAEEVDDDALKKVTSPVERRGGAFYEDLDLGLEPSVEVEEAQGEEVRLLWLTLNEANHGSFCSGTLILTTEGEANIS